MPPGNMLTAEIRAEIQRLAGDGPNRLEQCQRQAVAWSAAQADRFAALMRADSDEEADVLVRRAVLGCAPLGLVSGAWLQWFSAPGNADDPVVLRVLAVYATDVGVGRPRASRGSAFLAMLDRLRLAARAAPTSTIALEQRVADQAFSLPALLLAMSRHCDEFRPEILGADLCLRTVGLLPALAMVAKVMPAVADWDSLDFGAARAAGEPAAVELCRAAVADFLADRPAAAVRLAAGFRWALAALRDWHEALYAELAAARNPAFEMAELLRLRGSEGAIYHRKYRIAGKTLADWLTECRSDPLPLLNALAGSRLVRPGHSSASPLITWLIGEGGPMFRIFDAADLAVIRRWIDALPTEQPSTSAQQLPPSSSLFDQATVDSTVEDGSTPADLREAYHLLQARAHTSALHRYAVAYARGWLGRARYGMDRGDMPLPAVRPVAGLRPWLAQQHDRHAKEFEETAEDAVSTRQELIDSTVQLAPLTLIDGTWLQGFTDYEQASSEFGFPLFDTYWDELGNGEARLNHPLIYRELLVEMGVRLPPTASREFARWPGFREQSFALPVYWLCIGRFPRTFLPELLGLNLAMELSGVGGSYRRAHISLAAHGFSTRFVDVHNTIDNVATGHAAWAADAIDTYLFSGPGSPDSRAGQREWDRIRVGYRSLNPPQGWRAKLTGRRAMRRGASASEATR
ncbi:iron-containing redox enzyme family protein [Nocardia sp. NBC_01499]|uniref:iron-containing redox enzyme family protein n=1 Tax=Nocardia sp. NBC_01499 TaxID=2903597 RepID=UPI003868CFE8